MEICLLGSLACQLGDASHSLALFLALFDLVLYNLGNVAVNMQVVIDLLLYEVAYILIDTLAVRCHVGGAEFYLRLALEHRLFNVYGYGCHDAVAYVAILVFSEELLYGAGNMLLESALMGTALCCMLTVDKGVVLLTVLVGVGEGYLYVFALKVNDRIHHFGGHSVVKQVLESVTREYPAPVVHYGESCVQVGIVA